MKWPYHLVQAGQTVWPQDAHTLASPGAISARQQAHGSCSAVAAPAGVDARFGAVGCAMEH